ncbi:MAG TPA: Uma2 family endonuclease, partial [Myxococcaceae bacterium]|nr:Uma2 family endonuclease [Myxococcaceae bacterium]
ILSPATVHIDRERKLHIYAREHVGHAWLVDPRARTVEVFRREGEGWSFACSFSRAQRARAEPFDALELDLSTLWLEDEKPEAAR